MLDSLRFVQGAVAKKDLVQALTHFQIKGGYVKGHNGSMTLCAPINLNIDVMPKASSFAKAIATCKETITMHVTATGRLAIKSGPFRAYVDCVEEGYPDVEPEGAWIDLPNGGMLKAIKTLMPFIGEDASRTWARGILLRDYSAYATNNVVLLEYWLGYHFPLSINIPKSAITEMVRIGVDPVRMMASENSVTFFYENGSWLKTTLYSLDWPDLQKVLNRDSHPIPPPPGLWQAIEDASPFVDKLRRLWFRNDAITTDPTDATGALVEVPGLVAEGIYNADYLMDLAEVVETIDLLGYPGPSLFFGDKVRGAIIGMRGGQAA